MTNIEPNEPMRLPRIDQIPIHPLPPLRLDPIPPYELKPLQDKENYKQYEINKQYR